MTSPMTRTTDQPIPVEVVEYLRLHHIITLSTSSFTGMPHANTVAYANDDRLIYFAAPSTVQMVRNINDNHYVSFTIDDYTTDWRKVRELQGVGRCYPATDEERRAGWGQFVQKFGDRVVVPAGVVLAVRPLEMHFVDYTYEAATAGRPPQAPQMSSRSFEMSDPSTMPAHAAVSTSLNRSAYAPGEVIFRPGDPAGQYYIVLDGEVEVRGEGYGADQTVTRVAQGQLFGDQATLRGQRGALTAYAVRPTVLLAVQREAMRDLLLPHQQS